MTGIPLTLSWTRLDRSARPACTLSVRSMSWRLIALTTRNMKGYGAIANRVRIGSMANMAAMAYT